MSNCWLRLGLSASSDIKTIKRAYAKLLKQNNPEENPTGFQQLRQAYEQALQIAKQQANDSEKQTIKTQRLEFSSQNYWTQCKSVDKAQAQHTAHRSQSEEIQQKVKQIFATHTDEQHTLSFNQFLQLIDNPDYQSLDNQYQIEGEFLREFAHRLPDAKGLLLKLAEHYSWLHSNNPFEHDHSYKLYYKKIQLYLALHKRICQSCPTFTENDWSQFTHIVFSQFSEQHMHELYNANLEDACDIAFEYLQIHGHINYVGIINPYFISWWKRQTMQFESEFNLGKVYKYLLLMILFLYPLLQHFMTF